MCDVTMVRKVNARMLGRGLRLVNVESREWKVNQMLFANETALVADSQKKLCQLMEKFGQMCRIKNL